MRKEDPVIPVYLITGFLDSGKSQFLRYTMQEGYFNDGSKSLLILYEEGEEEFSQEVLRRTNTRMEIADSKDCLSEAYLDELNEKYHPERIMIEYNGMWDVEEFLKLKLPRYWTCYQIITVLDGENFGLYLNNIKMTAMNLLKNTDMVIFNRCKEDTDLVLYQRTVRSVNSRCDIAFEDDHGNEVICPEPDLPYDIEGTDIEISDENFGTFCIDVNEHPDRYVNKVIHGLFQIMQDKNFPQGVFVGGRKAMTCCEADIRFIPYIFNYDKAKSLENGCWANVAAELKWEYNEGYREEGPVFYVKDLKLAIKPNEELIYF